MRHISGSLLLFALLVLGSSQPSHGLDPARLITQHSHRLWTADHGLPQNTVRDIVQTPDGYLWIGTKAGLVRYDGLVFRTFDRTNTPEMVNQHIYALAVADDGALWIGTNGGGLLRLADGRFTAFGVAEGLPSGRITALTGGEGGTLFVGTYGGGLARIEGDRIDVFDARHGLDEPVVFALAADGAGGVYIGTYGGGLFRLRGETVVPVAAGALPDPGVWSLHRTASGLWVGTNRGLAWLGDDGGRDVFDRDSGLANARILSVLEDRDGIVWVGTYGGGLHRLTDDGVSRLTRQQTSSSDKIWSLFEDGEGSIWFGTLGGGLNQLTDGVFTSWSVEEGLASDLVNGFHEARDGAMWVGTRDRGLLRFEAGRWTQSTSADGLADDGLMDVMGTRGGELWLAHFRAGVSRLHDGGWTTYDVDDGLAHDFVNSLLETRDGAVWIGTNGGLNRWDGHRFERFTSADGLPSDQIRALHEDREGNVWIGSLGGLSRLDGEGFTSYTVADGLSSNNVWSIHEDGEGVLWLGTLGGGLNRVDGGRITRITSREGLYDDEVSALAEDDLGNLWMCTSRGVLRASLADLNAFSAGQTPRVSTWIYGRRDGLKSAECQNSRSFKSADGRLWFATLRGLAVADPERAPSSLAPATRIDAIELDGAPIPRFWDGRVAPGTLRLRVGLSAPSMLAPDRIRVRYRLDGYDPDWIDAGRQREALYGKLPPGTYTFRAMASDELGRWVGEEVEQSLTVLPAFRETPAFLVFCGLLAAALGWGIQLLRVGRLERREKELVAEVDKAVNRLRILRGLLPVCSGCKRIRGDRGSWQQLEAYIDQHSEATFTHGLCPNCADEILSEIERPEGIEALLD